MDERGGLTPSRRIAAGRSADIFEAGPGRVIRRRRAGAIGEAEVWAMRTARHHGYPVPEVFRVDGSDMEMERVDGDDLLALLARRPWRARRVARTLADLHLRLRDIPVPDGAGDALVHGDLHPGNVVVTSAGPMVIDWENARTGPADTDAAIVWLLLTVADADGVPALLRPVVPVLRRAVLRRFLREVGTPSTTTVASVCAERLGDPNMRPTERERIRRFRERHGRPVGAGTPRP